MSYRFKSKKFKCLDCKTTFSRLVQGDEVTSVNCENCGKASNPAVMPSAAASKEEVKGGTMGGAQQNIGGER